MISTIVDAMRGFPVHIFYTLNLHLVYFIVTIGLKPTGFRTQGQRRNDAGLGLRAFRSRRLALKSLRPGFRTQDMEIKFSLAQNIIPLDTTPRGGVDWSHDQ